MKINKKSKQCELIISRSELAALRKGMHVSARSITDRLFVSLRFVPKKSAELFKSLLDFKGIPIYAGKDAVMYEGEERCVIFFNKALLSKNWTHLRAIVKNFFNEKQIILKTE